MATRRSQFIFDFVTRTAEQNAQNLITDFKEITRLLVELQNAFEAGGDDAEQLNQDLEELSNGTEDLITINQQLQDAYNRVNAVIQQNSSILGISVSQYRAAITETDRLAAANERLAQTNERVATTRRDAQAAVSQSELNEVATPTSLTPLQNQFEQQVAPQRQRLIQLTDTLTAAETRLQQTLDSGTATQVAAAERALETARRRVEEQTIRLTQANEEFEQSSENIVRQTRQVLQAEEELAAFEEDLRQSRERRAVAQNELIEQERELVRLSRESANAASTDQLGISQAELESRQRLINQTQALEAAEQRLNQARQAGDAEQIAIEERNVENARARTAVATTELEAVEQSQSRLRRFLNQFVDQQAQATSNLQQAQNQLAQSLNRVSVAAQNQAQAQQRLAQLTANGASANAQTRAQNNLANATTALNNARNRAVVAQNNLTAAQRTAQRVQTQLAGTTNQVTQANNGLAGSANRAANATRNQNSASQNLASNLRSGVGGIAGFVQNNLTLIGSLALLGNEFRNIIDVTAEFGRAISNLEAISGANEEQIQALREQALELGSTTARTAIEAANAQTELARAGFEAGEILDATRSVIDLSVAANLSLARSAEIAAASLGTYQLAARELPRLNDLILSTTTSAALGVVDFFEAFRLAAPAFNAIGSPIEEVASSIGVLANAGIRGSIAGTTLRASINSLVKPSDQSQAALAQLGIQITDDAGAFLDFNDIIAQFAESQAELPELARIFGRNAANLNTIIQQQRDRFALTGESLDEYAARVGRAGQALRTLELNQSRVNGAAGLFNISLQNQQAEAILTLQQTRFETEEEFRLLAQSLGVLSTTQIDTLVASLTDEDTGLFNPTNIGNLSSFRTELETTALELQNVTRSFQENTLNEQQVIQLLPIFADPEDGSLEEAQDGLQNLIDNLEENAGDLRALNIPITLDAEGNIQNAETAINRIVNTVASNPNSAQAIELTRLLGDEITNLDEIAQRASDEGVQALREELENLSLAQQIAETQLGNLGGDITLFQSALEGLRVTIGEEFNEVFRGLTQGATAAIQVISELIKQGGDLEEVLNNQQLLRRIVGSSPNLLRLLGVEDINNTDAIEQAIDKIRGLIEQSAEAVQVITTVGSTLLAFRGLTVLTSSLNAATAAVSTFGPVFGGLLQTIGSIGRLLIGDFRALFTLITANPLGILVTAIGALTLSFIRLRGAANDFNSTYRELLDTTNGNEDQANQLLATFTVDPNQNIDEVRTNIRDLNDRIQQDPDGLLNLGISFDLDDGQVEDTVQAINATLSGFADSVFNADFLQQANIVEELFGEGIQQRLQSNVTQTQSIFQDLGIEVATNTINGREFIDTTDAIANLLPVIAQGGIEAEKAISLLGESTVDFINASDNFANNAGGIVEVTNQIQEAREFFAIFDGAVADLGRSFEDFLDIFDPLIQGFQRIFGLGTQVSTEITFVDRALLGVINALDGFLQVVIGLVTPIGNAFRQIISPVLEFGETLASVFSDGINFGDGSDIANAAANVIRGLFNGLTELVIQLGSAFVETIVGAFFGREVGRQVGSATRQLFTGISEFVSGGLELILSVARRISGFITDVFFGLLDAVQTVANAILVPFRLIGNGLQALGVDFNALGIGISRFIDSLANSENVFVRFVGRIAQGVRDTISGLVNFFSAFLGGGQLDLQGQVQRVRDELNDIEGNIEQDTIDSLNRRRKAAEEALKNEEIDFQEFQRRILATEEELINDFRDKASSQIADAQDVRNRLLEEVENLEGDLADAQEKGNEQEARAISAQLSGLRGQLGLIDSAVGESEQDLRDLLIRVQDLRQTDPTSIIPDNTAGSSATPTDGDFEDIDALLDQIVLEPTRRTIGVFRRQLLEDLSFNEVFRATVSELSRLESEIQDLQEARESGLEVNDARLDALIEEREVVRQKQLKLLLEVEQETRDAIEDIIKSENDKLIEDADRDLERLNNALGTNSERQINIALARLRENINDLTSQGQQLIQDTQEGFRVFGSIDVTVPVNYDSQRVSALLVQAREDNDSVQEFYESIGQSNQQFIESFANENDLPATTLEELSTILASDSFVSSLQGAGVAYDNFVDDFSEFSGEFRSQVDLLPQSAFDAVQEAIALGEGQLGLQEFFERNSEAFGEFNRETLERFGITTVELFQEATNAITANADFTFDEAQRLSQQLDAVFEGLVTGAVAKFNNDTNQNREQFQSIGDELSRFLVQGINDGLDPNNLFGLENFLNTEVFDELFDNTRVGVVELVENIQNELNNLDIEGTGFTVTLEALGQVSETIIQNIEADTELARKAAEDGLQELLNTGQITSQQFDDLLGSFQSTIDTRAAVDQLSALELALEELGETARATLVDQNNALQNAQQQLQEQQQALINARNQLNAAVNDADREAAQQAVQAQQEAVNAAQTRVDDINQNIENTRKGLEQLETDVAQSRDALRDRVTELTKEEERLVKSINETVRDLTDDVIATAREQADIIIGIEQEKIDKRIETFEIQKELNEAEIESFRELTNARLEQLTEEVDQSNLTEEQKARETALLEEQAAADIAREENLFNREQARIDAEIAREEEKARRLVAIESALESIEQFRELQANLRDAGEQFRFLQEQQRQRERIRLERQLGNEKLSGAAKTVQANTVQQISDVQASGAAGIKAVLNTIATGGFPANVLALATVVGAVISAINTVRSLVRSVQAIRQPSISSTFNAGNSGLPQNFFEEGGPVRYIRQGDKASSGGRLKGRRHSAGGIMIEAEDGEYVLNRKAVQIYGPAIDVMNEDGLRGRKSLNFGMVSSSVASPTLPMVSTRVLTQPYAQTGGLVGVDVSGSGEVINELQQTNTAMISELQSLRTDIQGLNLTVSASELEEARRVRQQRQNRRN